MPKSPHAEDSFEGVVGPYRHRMPRDRAGINHKVEILDETHGGMLEGYIIGNLHEDGSLGEVFLQGFGKEGSTLDGWVQFSAILFSIALQYGAEFAMLARKTAHMKFEPYGKTTNPEIPYCRSVPDYLVRWLALRFGDDKLRAELDEIHKKLETP